MPRLVIRPSEQDIWLVLATSNVCSDSAAEIVTFDLRIKNEPFAVGDANIVHVIRQRSTKYFSAVILVAAAAVVSGGSAGATAKRVNLSAAYRATLAATSVKESISEVLVANGTSETLHGSGALDSRGDGSFTLQVAGQSIDTMIDNGTMYLKVPATSMAALQVTTPWVSLNMNALSKAKLGASYQQLASYGQQGPAQSLAILQNASSSGDKLVGTATLFGVKTTEYRTTINLNKVASASGNPALTPVITNLDSKHHVSSIPVKVWVDAQQRVRRLVELVKPSTAESATTTVNIEAFDVPVTVTPPPADQVTDVTAKVTGSSNG
jgi:hypothetical protein